MQFPYLKKQTFETQRNRGTRGISFGSILHLLLFSSAYSFPLCFTGFLDGGFNPPAPASPPSPASSQYAVRCAGPKSDEDQRHGCASRDRLSGGSTARETSRSPVRENRRKSPCLPIACRRRTTARPQEDENTLCCRSAPRRTLRRHA